MNLHQKVNAVMSEVQRLEKDDRVKFGSTDYKALSEEKVTTIIRERLVKYGLTVVPIDLAYDRKGNIASVVVKYRLTDIDNPEDFIDVVSCGEGADTQDKAAGKAMTYALKYLWLRMFAIPTGEDPDKISSEELDIKFGEKVQCVKCGAEIKSTKDRYGKQLTASEVKEKLHGMCEDCYKQSVRR